MSVPFNLPFQLWEARAKAVKSATVALTVDEVEHGFIEGDTAAGAVALTLPAATHAQEGHECIFVNTGANALTVVVAAGYGGAGGGSDTITLARGEMSRVLCYKANWYAQHHTAAG